MQGETPFGDPAIRQFDEELSQVLAQLVGPLLGTEDRYEIARRMMRYYHEYRDLDDLNLSRVCAAFRLFRFAVRSEDSSRCWPAPDAISQGLDRWGMRAVFFLGRFSILGRSSPFEGSFVSEAVFASVMYICLQDHRQEWGLIDENQAVVIGFCAQCSPSPEVGRLLISMAVRVVQVCNARMLPRWLLFLIIVARLVNSSVRPEEIPLSLPANCTTDAIEYLNYWVSLAAGDPKVWHKHAEYSEYVGDSRVSEAVRQDFILICRALSAKLAQGQDPEPSQ